MKMGIYDIFSCNVEIQYKSYFLSKAMMFTILTTMLTILLPFILAYRSKGFWLKSHYFFEQPTVYFTYEYLLLAETDDPSTSIICGEAPILANIENTSEEYCAEIQVQEKDHNVDGKNDVLDFKFHIVVPKDRTISSLTFIIALDFQLKHHCPIHSQTLLVVNRDFAVAPSGLKYYGDLQLYQVSDLACISHHIDTKYNTSILGLTKGNSDNIIDFILEHYFSRTVITEGKTLFTQNRNGHTGTFDLEMHLRIPEMRVQYTPSFLQELKWAWPQYLSIASIFHWVFYRITKFVYNNRLLMAWEVVPWKKH